MHTLAQPLPPLCQSSVRTELAGLTTPGMDPLGKYPFSPDRVAVALCELPDDQREPLLWLDEYARTENLALDELAARLLKPSGRDCYSENTVFQVLTGKETSLANFVGAVQAFRAAQRPRIVAPDEFPFVRTAVADSIWAYTDLVRKWHKIGLLIGESQTGKSRALREYVAAHPGCRIFYHQIPIGGHKSKVVHDLCKLMGVSTKYSTHEKEHRIAQAVDRDTLIIADEMQQCAARPLTGGRVSSERVDAIEFYRWLRDTRKCAVLLVGTTEALHMLRGDGDGHISRGIFVQTLKRALDPYILRHNPPPRDLNAFAAQLKLKPAEGNAAELQRETVIQRGLEIWLTYLLAGAELAAVEDRPVTWRDVLNGAATFKSGGAA